MMWGGKKSTAQSIFYEAMTNLEQKGGDEALKLFKKGCRERKADAGSEEPPRRWSQLQVPIEVNPERRTSLAIRWLVSFGRARGERAWSKS